MFSKHLLIFNLYFSSFDYNKGSGDIKADFNYYLINVIKTTSLISETTTKTCPHHLPKFIITVAFCIMQICRTTCQSLCMYVFCVLGVCVCVSVSAGVLLLWRQSGRMVVCVCVCVAS